MAVVCLTENGCVIDHQQLVNNWYKDCLLTSTGRIEHGHIQTTASFQIKPDLFLINNPFMMDSQFDKLQRSTETSGETCKKRKRKSSAVVENADSEIINKVIEHHKQLMTLAKKKGYFIKNGNKLKVQDRAECHGPAQSENLSSNKLHDSSNDEIISRETILTHCDQSNHRTRIEGLTGEVTSDNNKSARMAANIKGSVDKLSDKVDCHKNSDVNNYVLNISSEDTRYNSIQVNQLTQYNNDHPIELQIYNDKYLLPTNCKFLLSDWTQLLNITQVDNTCYDLIVMDPPWMNKSVKRKKSYNTVWEDTILELPVHLLCNKSCLIVIWVTNKTRLHSFIKETLIPKWNLKHCVLWHWLKVTTSGEMVCDITKSNIKKPYESLYLARYDPTDSCQSNLPVNQTIISIPCSIHSKKPPLSEILRPYLPANPRCLELFARNLHPGWTSWGNEVLLHQHLDFYEVVK